MDIKKSGAIGFCAFVVIFLGYGYISNSQWVISQNVATIAFLIGLIVSVIVYIVTRSDE